MKCREWRKPNEKEEKLNKNRRIKCKYNILIKEKNYSSRNSTAAHAGNAHTHTPRR